jgi:hypothetical protein
MSLSLSCQPADMQKAGTHMMSPLCILAPESALGSHSCVALSSAQATQRLPKTSTAFRVLFLMRQRIRFRVLFCLSQRGGMTDAASAPFGKDAVAAAMFLCRRGGLAASFPRILSTSRTERMERT